MWLQQQEPPDADERSGGDVGGDGGPCVRGGQLTGERLGDRLRCAERGDRFLLRLVVGDAVGDAVFDGVGQAVA